MQNVADRINYHKKSLRAVLAGSILACSLLFAPLASAITIGGPSDCDSNAIIRCGAHSTSALMQAYNSSAYIQKVYAYFGISGADIANLPGTDAAGTVTKDGKVFVDGQSRAVATNAVTGGRQNIAGSSQVNFQGAVFFKRPPSVSFQQSSLPAFVSMKNGVFQFAVIASCGNAVKASPTTTPHAAAVAPARAVSKPSPQPRPQAKAKPAPTQAQAQLQAQSQEVNINNSNTQNVQPAPATETTTPTETASTPEQPAATQPASSLVNTGPAGTIGVFLAATGIGIAGYRRFILRKLLS